MKYFRMSYEEVVFKRSYLNLILLNRAIPGYKPTNESDDDVLTEEQIEKLDEKDKIHANNFFLNFM